MRPLAFFLTAAGFTAIFLATIVAGVTLAARNESTPPQLSLLAR
jgi:hypothetical protein